MVDIVCILDANLCLTELAEHWKEQLWRLISIPCLLMVSEALAAAIAGWHWHRLVPQHPAGKALVALAAFEKAWLGSLRPSSAGLLLLVLTACFECCLACKDLDMCHDT